MTHVKCKKLSSKSYIMYNSMDMTFWKMQKYRDRKHISCCHSQTISGRFTDDLWSTLGPRHMLFHCHSSHQSFSNQFQLLPGHYSDLQLVACCLAWDLALVLQTICGVFFSLGITSRANPHVSAWQMKWERWSSIEAVCPWQITLFHYFPRFINFPPLC